MRSRPRRATFQPGVSVVVSGLPADSGLNGLHGLLLYFSCDDDFWAVEFQGHDHAYVYEIAPVHLQVLPPS